MASPVIGHGAQLLPEPPATEFPTRYSAAFRSSSPSPPSLPRPSRPPASPSSAPLQWAVRGTDTKIETYHKVLKSGCRIEESKLRTAERLTNLIAVFCIVAWRVFWLTMVRRTNPKASAELAFTETEITILNHLTSNPEGPPPQNVAHYVLAVAKLGGYLARKNDGPPGNTVLWRGLTRLTDIQLGLELSRKVVGN